MSGIVWLASYPKSGNTWFRVFLANLRGEGRPPADINDLRSSLIASARELFDDAVGIESSDLTHEEAERLRPEVYEELARQSGETLFVKIHDAFTRLQDGRPLFAGPGVLCSICIIRNPLDIAISLAHHLGSDIDTAIGNMDDPEYAFCQKPRRLHNQLRQRLLTWSEHVLSWVDAPGLRVHVMRYEDMHLQPLETFAAAVSFAGLREDSHRIARALELSSFVELQRQEEEHGFREKSPAAQLFFRKGKIGSWREVMNEVQVARVVEAHGAVMRRFDYLTERGEIVF